MMDPAAMQVLVDAVTAMKAAAEAMTMMRSSGGAGGVGIHKHFSRVEKLDPDAWKEWHYQFVVATSAFNIRHGALLEIVEQKEIDDVTTESLELVLNASEADYMRRTQAELFSVLTLLTKGEANQIVRSCDDMNGYVAWKKLYDRFNPKTPASLTAAWRDVIRPKKLKDIREASKAIDAWESKLVVLKKEHNEEPTTGLKASLLLEMLPDSVQMTVAQGMSTKKLDYDSLKSKIKLMASVQMDYATPKPMDIGETHEAHDGNWDTEGWDYEVEAVGAQKGKGKGPLYGSCWTCGGAHFSRDCPKGGGKGPKGSGKGSGKGDAVGKGKGKGKLPAPMYGSCWTCGGTHFSRDCPNGDAGGAGGKGGGKSKGKGKSLREVDEDDEGETEEVGGVSECWNIFGIDEGGGKRKKAARSGKWTREGPGVLELSNRFELLQEVDDIGLDDHAGLSCITCGNCITGGNCFTGGNCITGGYCDIGLKDGIGLDDGAEEVPGSSINPKGSGLSRNPWRREEAEEAEWIQWVADGKSCSTGWRGEIVVDSGAAESVCPWDWATDFPIKDVPQDHKTNFPECERRQDGALRREAHLVWGRGHEFTDEHALPGQRRQEPAGLGCEDHRERKHRPVRTEG